MKITRKLVASGSSGSWGLTEKGHGELPGSGSKLCRVIVIWVIQVSVFVRLPGIAHLRLVHLIVYKFHLKENEKQIGNSS